MSKKILWVSTCPFVGGGEQFLVNTLLPLADEFELVGLAATDWLCQQMPCARLFKGMIKRFIPETVLRRRKERYYTTDC